MIFHKQYTAVTIGLLLFLSKSADAQQYQVLHHEAEEKERVAELASVAIEAPVAHNKYELTKKWSCAATRLEKVEGLPFSHQLSHCRFRVAGNYLFCFSANGKEVHVCNLNTKLYKKISIDEPYDTYALSPQGEYIAYICYLTGDIVVCNIMDGEKIANFRGVMKDYGYRRFSLFFSVDSNYIYALAKEKNDELAWIDDEHLSYRYYGKKLDIALGETSPVMPGCLPLDACVPECKKNDWWEKQYLTWTDNPGKQAHFCYLSHLLRYYGTYGHMATFIGVTALQEPVIIIERDVCIKDSKLPDGIYIVKRDDATVQALDSLTTEEQAFLTKLESKSTWNLGTLILSAQQMEQFKKLPAVLQKNIVGNCRVLNAADVSCKKQLQLLLCRESKTARYFTCCSILAIFAVGGLLLGTINS